MLINNVCTRRWLYLQPLNYLCKCSALPFVDANVWFRLFRLSCDTGTGAFFSFLLLRAFSRSNILLLTNPPRRCNTVLVFWQLSFLKRFKLIVVDSELDLSLLITSHVQYNGLYCRTVLKQRRYINWFRTQMKLIINYNPSATMYKLGLVNIRLGIGISFLLQ